MMRLPKPAETNVTHDKRYIGSVYTAEQMSKYAVKAVLEEREACAKVCDLGVDTEHPTVKGHIMKNFGASPTLAAAIRARGERK